MVQTETQTCSYERLNVSEKVEVTQSECRDTEQEEEETVDSHLTLEFVSFSFNLW